MWAKCGQNVGKKLYILNNIAIIWELLGEII
jgi:hypothetical protein